MPVKYMMDVTPFRDGESLTGFPIEIKAASKEAAIAEFEEQVSRINGEILRGAEIARLYTRTKKGETTMRTQLLNRPKR